MIRYRDARASDLDSVGRLHIHCFQGSFISSLGERLISNYYREFLEEGGPFVLALEDNSLIGLCMGYYSGSKAIKSFIRKNRILLSFRVLVLCISFNKTAWKKVWAYLFRSKASKDTEREVKADADLLSVCVLREYWGQGISANLMKEFERRLVEAKKKDLKLTVYKYNDRAISFYKKEGYAIVSESGDGYKMYKSLFV